MTREIAKELLPIIQAFAEGKTIEVNNGTRPQPTWLVISYPDFARPPQDYRIKPEPREWYANVCSDGSGSIHTTQDFADFAKAHSNPERVRVRVREVLD